MTKKQGDEPEGIVQRRIEEDDDVEGHSMLIDPSSARHLARAREQEIRRHLEKHELEQEARPHKRER